jgi:putative inorganic carbon (HCO3(-)) transporter
VPQAFHRDYLVYWVTGIFLLLNAVAIYFEFFYLPILPLFLAIVGVTFFRMDAIFFLIVLATPLSINLEGLEFGLGLALPTEPLMAGLLLVFLAKQLYEGSYDTNILKHPISLAILFYLLWIFITALLSELPLVSFKFLISKLWFIVPFFFFAVQIFRNPKNVDRFIWFYTVPMVFVIGWSTYNLAIRGFDEKPAHWVMQPFFKDHTSYGAIVAFYIPVLMSYLNMKIQTAQTKFLVGTVLFVFLIGVVFSYTRAAWVSLVAALGVYLIIKWRIRLSYLFVAGGLALVLLFSFKTEILQKLEKNKQDSSADLAKHVKSISNVASDASNLERLNRWDCALQMFQERPITGYGPGTYSFLYAPYQKSYNLTIISTNFGDLGNAHSEYFGPLAETGIIGGLSFLFILIAVFYKGVTLYYRMDSERHKAIMLGAVLGLVTYYTHGILNNYLDLDKASVPFWGFIAIIASMDIYYAQHYNKSIQPKT